MKHWMPLRIAKFVVLAVVFLAVIGWVVMGLWNALIPDLFRGPVLSYWQAVGLLLLAHLLFRGPGRWRHSGGWRHGFWKHRLQERFASMTPEEQEKFKEDLRRRCGWTPFDEKEKPNPSNA